VCMMLLSNQWATPPNSAASSIYLNKDSMNSIFTKVYFSYSTKKRCSRTQLLDDFQEFPPTPLNCPDSLGNFYVVTTRGFGDFCNCAGIISRLLYAAARDKNLVSMEFLEIAGLKKELLFLKLILLSPILLYKLFRMCRNTKGGAGLFLPFLSHENRITIRLDANRQRVSIDPVVSHEHIHFLQHRRAELHSRSVRNVGTLISDKYKEEPSLLYLLQKKEIEARLHELVLSYYRVSKRLPLTTRGFLELMAGSEQCGPLVIEALNSRGINLGDVIINYAERDILFAEDVANVLVTIRDIDFRYRFIGEVLAVMYGNLMCYYGDVQSSRKFMNEIERPNLYDFLYGQEVVEARNRL
jgi:hypothetical protein